MLALALARIRATLGVLARGGGVVQSVHGRKSGAAVFQLGLFVGFTRGPVGLRGREGGLRVARLATGHPADSAGIGA